MCFVVSSTQVCWVKVKQVENVGIPRRPLGVVLEPVQGYSIWEAHWIKKHGPSVSDDWADNLREGKMSTISGSQSPSLVISKSLSSLEKLGKLSNYAQTQETSRSCDRTRCGNTVQNDHFVVQGKCVQEGEVNFKVYLYSPNCESL